MVIFADPAKVEIIFGRPHPIAPPWLVSASMLTPIDDHLWDWALWLRAGGPGAGRI